VEESAIRAVFFRQFPMINFPSGEWVGFYTYRDTDRRFLMDLRLEFKGGSISGDGADGIGEFVISGTYSESDGECQWTKAYVGLHTVEYRGFRENKGIWGTWAIEEVTGGFQIWPIGQNGESMEERKTEKLVVPGPPVPQPVTVRLHDHRRPQNDL
jgi:hypothetical protein